MKIKQFEVIRRALWTIGQPLTRVPSQSAVPVSDLFVWRISRDWQTSFELIDMPGLFAGEVEGSSHFATIHCFDQSGHCFLRERLPVLPNRRQTIEMAGLVGMSHGEIGTFAVFHSETPPAVVALESHLAERGYVSYRFRDAPVRAYVHGNFDAISLVRDAKLEPLGARGLLPREYRLQHEMKGRARYELGLVNPTNVKQECAIELVSTRDGTVMDAQLVTVKSKGVALIPHEIDESRQARVVIRSRLVMARPLVFRIQDQTLDVFHG